jgi:transglutaminase-like putative cysteine protease
MIYQVEHRTTFSYDTRVDQSMNTLRLKPRSDECQRLLHYRTILTPATLTQEHVDLWGNHVETFYIPERHQQLDVTACSTVSIQKSPFIHHISYSPEMERIFHSELFRQHYLPYLSDTARTYVTPEQVNAVRQEIGPMANPLQYALAVMDYIHTHFAYEEESTTVKTRAQDAFALRKGVCQDFSHIMLGILHAEGIPARYVSGYLYVGEDSALKGDAATHAWVEVMAPGIGWIGLDPTNNREALDHHIRVGTGRDYADVSPLTGVYRGGGQTLAVKVAVTLLKA